MILDSALRIFAAKGYAAANISEIAAEARVGKGTIYEYHQSKEDLFFAVFEDFVETSVSRGVIDAESLEGDEIERLQMLLKSCIQTCYYQIEAFNVSMEFWAAAGTPSLRDRFRTALLDLYDSLRSVIAEFIAAGKKTGIFRADVNEHNAAAGIVGSIDGLMLQAWLDRKFDVLSVAEEYFELVIAGMRPAKG